MNKSQLLQVLFPPFYFAQNGRWIAAIVSFGFWPFASMWNFYQITRGDKDRDLYLGAQYGECCPFCRNALNEGSTVCAHCHATYHVSGLGVYWFAAFVGAIFLLQFLGHPSAYTFGSGLALFVISVAAIVSPFVAPRSSSWRRFERQ